MPARIRPEERQFNLVLALLSTRHGMTRDAIFASVRGYTDEHRESLAAVSRMFERDKALLRDAGVPLVTIPDPFEPENNQLTRYRIEQMTADTALPDFTEAELAMVSLAIAVWHHGTRSSTATNLLAKLRAANIPVATAGLDIPTGVRGPAPAAEAINRAIVAHAQLTFAYTTQGFDTPLARHVLPFALVTHHDDLLLYGWDLDRNDYRTFLLDRISGTLTSREYRGAIRWPDSPIEDALAALQAAAQTAVLTAREHSTAAVLFRRMGTETAPGRFTVPFTDRTLTAALIASFDTDVVVLAPPALRDEVMHQLQGIVTTHTAPPKWPSDVVAAPVPATVPSPDPVVLLMSLVPYLLQHPGVTATDVAQAFDTTPAMIEQAINTLAVSGVPGESAMYDPQDLFDIDWDSWERDRTIFLTHTVGTDHHPQLSTVERSAVIVALHMLASTLTSEQAATALSAARKLGAPDTTTPPAVRVDAELDILRTALDTHQRVRLRYVSADERVTERFVDPEAIELIANRWYLRGVSYTLDGELQGERTFRVDRIDEVHDTGVPASAHPSQETLKTLLGSPTIIHVVERVERADGPITRTLDISGTAAYLRSIAGSNARRSILAPEALRQALVKRATAALAQYT